MPRKGNAMNKKLKRSVSAALVCAMMLTTSTAALNVAAYADNTTVSTTASKTKSYTVKRKKVNFYFADPSIKNPSNVYFVNGTDIPYMELEELLGYLSFLMNIEGLSDFKIDMKVSGNKVTLTREHEYPCVIDFADDTIYFMDYNAFGQFGTDSSIMELTGVRTTDENGKPTYIKRLTSSNNERYGSDVTFDLGAYNIDLVRKGDKYLIPIQTFSDIFLYNVGLSVMYNGKSLFFGNCSTMMDSENNITALGKLYFREKSKKDKISKALTEFNYNELCLALDTHYGLKEIHNIDSFDKLMRNTGLKSLMLSQDPKKMDTAVYDLVTKYLDDIHTKYGMSSPATGFNFGKELIESGGEGPSRDAYAVLGNGYKTVRAKFYPDGVPAYEEVGDTAFITFDAFVAIPEGVDYYKKAPTADAKDTMGIIAYSVQQILRKDSPIKNVVLDLSCNSGGSADTAVYTLAAFLGRTNLSIQDSFTGAFVTNAYIADTNFDGKFNSKDTLAGKGLNLYCLESGVSFSCGNLVPSMFKQSSDVSLIGETSGGGSCSVQWVTTATGSAVRISSPNRLSFMKNGSFYDIDRGADPDIYLTKKDSYYDREKLVEYLNSLL